MKLNAELFGKKVTYEYSEHWIGYSIFFLRLAMAWIFLQAGLVKLFAGDWTAKGYLSGVSENNPFYTLFQNMAGSVIVDQLVIWGLTLIGVALLLGVAVRFACFWGITMMILFWASHLQGGFLAGLPVSHGWVISEHLVYAILLFALGTVGAGRIFGIDGKLTNTEFIKKHPALERYLG